MKTFLLKYALVLFGLLAAFTLAISPARASVPAQTDLIEHGKYIATIAGCTSCHTNSRTEYLDPSKLTLEQIQTLAFDEQDARDNDKLLAGGRLFPLGPAGNVYSANITPDKETGIGSWTDEQIKVAIRTGQIPSGRQLFPIMPYFTFNSMADADLDAVVAYIRSVPAVKNEAPASTVSTQGMQPLPYQQGIVAPPVSDKAARGEYLVKSVSACTDCHTPLDPATGAPMMNKYLAGGQPYEGPWGIVYGGNITPDVETGIGSHTEGEIKQALIAGINNKGRRLILMPWFAYAGLTNDDADAVAYYLKNKLPAVKNEVPDASLNEAFNVLAPAEEPAPPASNFSVPIAAGLGMLLILVIVLLATRMRRNNQAQPKQ